MLWTDEALEAEELLRAFPDHAKHSARYLKERNPKLYRAIELALKFGIPVTQITQALTVSENTVRAVGFAEARSVEEGKEDLKTNMRRFLRGGMTILVEKMHEIPVEKLAMAMGIINQNLLLLEGGATQIVRHEQALSVEDYAKMIEAAQRKAHGTVVDEAQETGSEAEKKSLTREGAGGRAGAGSLTDSGSDMSDLGPPSGSEALGNPMQLVDTERDERDLYRALYQSEPERGGDRTGGPEGSNGGGGGSSRAGGEDGR